MQIFCRLTGDRTWEQTFVRSLLASWILIGQGNNFWAASCGKKWESQLTGMSKERRCLHRHLELASSEDKQLSPPFLQQYKLILIR